MTEKTTFKNELIHQIKGIGLLAVAVFCYFSLVYTQETGQVGGFISRVLETLAGETAVVIPFLLGILALRSMLPQKVMDLKSRFTGLVLLLLLFTVAFHFQAMLEQIDTVGSNFYLESLELGASHQQGGGLIGALFAIILHFFFDTMGSYVILATLAVVSVLLIANVTLTQIVEQLKKLIKLVLRGIKRAGRFLKELYSILMTEGEEDGVEKEENDINDNIKSKIKEAPGHMPEVETVTSATTAKKPVNGDGYQKERTIEFGSSKEDEETGGVHHGQDGSSIKEENSGNEVAPSRQYTFPPLSLLSKSSGSHQSQEKNIQNRASLLENTLHSFGVKAKVVNVHSGPTVTRFEVQPEAGVKVSKIISLSDDIALNLAAPDIRIEAPIPGKAALGIEVPNKVISLIYLREVLEDPSFQDLKSPLTIALGKDITGIPVVTSLEHMPHLLIAGATGAGKSVCLNSLITSILFKADPEEVKLLMIDPKMVELGVFNGIPHLISPVVTDAKKASVALKNMVKEMNRRYDMFAQEGVRDITSYNEKVQRGELQGETLPFIVVIVDELADLMLVSPAEVEDAIARLAQMSRAAGIHLVIATQRPSVDVLTGIIKANITSRIAFTVSSQVDSRTILDMAGAEKLLGKGDMLYYPVGAVKPMRVQGAFLSENELQEVINYVRQQSQEETSDETITQPQEEDSNWDEVDELFPEAVELIVRTGQASVSLLQRRFRIGYTRAARLMDDLERKGVVGEHEGSKPREILVSPEEASQLYEEYKEEYS